MRKYCFMVVVVLMVSLFSITGFAQGWPERGVKDLSLLASNFQPWPPRGNPPIEPAPQPKVLKDVAPTPAPAPSDFTNWLNNVGGDIGVLFSASGKTSFAPGIGVDIVTYKGLVTLRGEAFLPSTSTLGSYNGTMAGAALMVNLPQLVGQISSASWLLNSINPSIGVVGLWDFNNSELAFGPMLSIINIKF